MNIKIYIVASIIYMFIGVLFGAVISGGPLADYVETEEGHWIENIHSFVSFNGFFALMLMGFSYFLIPQMTRRKIYEHLIGTNVFGIRDKIKQFKKARKRKVTSEGTEATTELAIRIEVCDRIWPEHERIRRMEQQQLQAYKCKENHV